MGQSGVFGGTEALIVPNAEQVEYKGEQLQVLPEQMLGMLMAQLMRHARGGAPNAAPRPLGITVISVPAVFSDRQRSAVMAAARIAGDSHCSLPLGLPFRHLHPHTP